MTPEHLAPHPRCVPLAFDDTEPRLSKPSEALRPMPGRLGRYMISRELGRGGMGSVLLARDEDGGRAVALKRLHPWLASDARHRQLFLREGILASWVRHPHICAVKEVERVDDEWVLVMEHLMGQPLSRIYRALRHSSVAPAKLLARLVADLAEGLDALHQLKSPEGLPLSVVHRDVSPDNLFLTYDGIAKVMDLGIASSSMRAIRDEDLLTGKAAYLAPEVIEGQPASVASDVWSLGVVAWELLSGRRLFRSTDRQGTLDAVLQGAIPRPSAMRGGIPAELDRLVLKALARDPADRFASARAFAQELRLLAPNVGMAELALWLEGLFPGGLGEQLELRRAACLALPIELTTPRLPPVRDSRPGLVQAARRRARPHVVESLARKPRRRSRVLGTLAAIAPLLMLVGLAMPSDRAAAAQVSTVTTDASLQYVELEPVGIGDPELERRLPVVKRMGGFDHTRKQCRWIVGQADGA